MRKIFFKAKRLDNGEWVEGNLVLSPKADEDFKAIIIPLEDNGEYTQGINDDLGFETWYKVDRNTICRYTGLTDKNGNKIWENDFVDIQHYATKAHKVKWGYGGFCVGINGLLCHYNTVCEVIGNIFDNPELLEGGGEE